MGILNAADKTLTGSGREVWRGGAIKMVNLREVATLLLYHSFIQGESTSGDVARKVLEKY